MEMVLHNDTNKLTYSLFKDEKELKRHIWCWINELELEDHLKETLLKLGQLSRKFFGLSFKRQNHLAEDFGLSKRQVQRRIDALEKLGIIKQIPTCDKKGQQMQNFIQVQPFPKMDEIESKKAEEKQGEQQMSPPVSSPMSSHTVISLPVISSSSIFINNVKGDEISKESNEDIIELPSYIPEEFVKRMNSLIGNDYQTIYKLWGKVKMASRKVNFTSDINEHIGHIIRLFIQSRTLGIKLKKLKKGNSMDAVIGHWFGSIKKYLIKIQEEDFNYEPLFTTPVSNVINFKQMNDSKKTKEPNKIDGIAISVNSLKKSSAEDYKIFKQFIYETCSLLNINTKNLSVLELLYAIKDSNSAEYSKVFYKLFQLTRKHKTDDEDMPY